MAPFSCGVNVHSGTNRSVIRRELRKIVPKDDLREEVGISLARSAPLLLEKNEKKTGASVSWMSA